MLAISWFVIDDYITHVGGIVWRENTERQNHQPPTRHRRPSHYDKLKHETFQFQVKWKNLGPVAERLIQFAAQDELVVE